MSDGDRTQRALGDMVPSGVEIEQYVTALGEQNFYADRPPQLVAEALLHRLGEAVSRIDRDSPAFVRAHPEIEWTTIQALRSFMVREDGFIDHSMVWRALSVTLPKDVAAIRRLMERPPAGYVGSTPGTGEVPRGAAATFSPRLRRGRRRGASGSAAAARVRCSPGR